MKLAVSNIAWSGDALERHLPLLRRLGCDGVEVAPSCIWEDPVKATSTERARVRTVVEECGLGVVGLHSLFYNRPELMLFSDTRSRQGLADYTRELMGLCRDLGGRTLVFGSPRNRQRGRLGLGEALQISADFFRQAAEAAEQYGVLLCIEPLGPDETDFITSSHEGADLVRRVDHPNFRLHLDAKAMVSAKEDHSRVFRQYVSLLEHFHVGDPGLAPPGSTGVDHSVIGRALTESGYSHFVSIEVRRGPGPPEQVIEQSVVYVRRSYWGQTPATNGA